MTHPLESAYKAQRKRAEQRGIEWGFTFETWLGVWDASGVAHLRGKRMGQYVMARNGDVGPYTPDNVVICTVSQNFKDAYKNGRGGGNCNLGKFHPKQGEVRKATGWTYIKKNQKNPYQVMFRRKYVGVFPTMELAERAYAEELKKFSALSTGNSTGRE